MLAVSQTMICRDSDIGVVVKSPETARKIFSPLMLKERETFCVMFLDSSYRVIVAAAVADGNENTVEFDSRALFRAAVMANAAAMIVAHNHPSGNPVPSDADIFVTRRLEEGAKTLGILFVDHLVLTAGERYQSIFEYMEMHPGV